MLALLAAVVAQLNTAQPVRAPDSLLGPGISASLAEYRTQRIRNVKYHLVVDVTSRDTATGRVTISFALRRPADVVVDFRGPRLWGVRVNGRPIPNPEFNGAHLRIPSVFVQPGQNRIDAEFTTLMAAAGTSIIRVRDPSDGAWYLYTLLVPSDANQLFPCFDQPDLKARTSLTLVTPMGWRALANGALLNTDSTSRGTLFTFRETEPISTYLMAFAAGPWTELKSRRSGRAITLFVRRSRARDVEADSIILANDRAVSWLEGYFASRYPFHKFDILLAPAFPFGGMEHPGAIFYNEESFIYRERPTQRQRLGRTATIYHEVAHQWFGDLVTMRWFDDLWLKEGFATYMAALMQSALDPTSESWKNFYLRNKPQAYAVDATEGTRPVWQRLENLDQAKSNYGAIVYNKAPSVIKQLHYTVGDTAFRTGLRRLLRDRAYGNATWRDLLDVIGTASGKPLDQWGAEYILRAGMPRLEQRLEVRDGRIARLMLVQRPERATFGARPWPMRVEVLLHYDEGPAHTIPVTVARETTVVNAARGRSAPAFVFANSRDYGYALVELDSASLSWLERNIGGVKESFLRAMLWGALWDRVRDAALPPERFVESALRELPTETDEQIVGSILGRLTRAITAYLATNQRAALLPRVEQLLSAGASNASRSYGIRKSHLDALIRVAGSAEGIATLDALLDSTHAAGEPLRGPTRWAIVTRLLATSAARAEERYRVEMMRDTTNDGLRRAFAAGAARANSETKATYFARYFADSTLNEEWVTASLDAFNALEAQTLTRPHLPAALDSLSWIQKHRRIFFLGSWLTAFLEGQTEPEALAIVTEFLRARTDLAPDLRAKVLQAVDELERTVAIREGRRESGERSEGVDPIPRRHR
jgi:aminopeptidase N